MEIEVGEYGRTNKGKIFIFVWVENANYILVKTRNEKQNNDILNFDKYYLDKDEEIVNHNKIISEIVEVGDYINGKLIHKINKGPNYCYLYYGNCKTFVDYQIKTIVTKEQMASIEYKVEEDK